MNTNFALFFGTLWGKTSQQMYVLTWRRQLFYSMFGLGPEIDNLASCPPGKCWDGALKQTIATSTNFSSQYSEIIQAFCYIYHIQHHVSLINHLIHGASLGVETSWRVARLVVCYVVLYYSYSFCNKFRPYKTIIRWITYVVAAANCFL
jgi:hypothetical protein